MIQNNLNKLKEAKTSIRKALQRKNTGVSLDTSFTNYYEYIRNMSDEKNPNLSNLRNYAEDRLSYLEINVDRIRPFAFRYFTCLKGLYLNNSKIVALDHVNAFYEINPIIYVPANLYDQYIVADNWKDIKDRIQVYQQEQVQEMFLLEYIDYVQTVDWLEEKTIEELILDFR